MYRIEKTEVRLMHNILTVGTVSESKIEMQLTNAGRRLYPNLELILRLKFVGSPWQFTANQLERLLSR
jgi:hypothetical protein